MSQQPHVMGTETEMLPLFQARTKELQRRLKDEGIDILLITHADSIYYYSAYWGDLGLEFGRPTILTVASNGDVTLITAGSETLMAQAMTWVDDLAFYSDGVGEEWRDPLNKALGSNPGNLRIATERNYIPAVISNYLDETVGTSLTNGTPIIAAMRMIKSPDELNMVRQAGQVAVEMGIAGRDAMAVGVPEYEVSIACMNAGTRKAADIIAAEDQQSLMSPMIHNLQAI
ncbi:MAG: aminopeptidase P family protein, partial [Gammaproteobacteria bacterium]|nr:aminopeptidase P family protein [Gammaproteobacteria bacterium]